MWQLPHWQNFCYESIVHSNTSILFIASICSKRNTINIGSIHINDCYKTNINTCNQAATCVQCMYFTLVLIQITCQFTEPNLTASNQKGFLAWQVSNIPAIKLFNIQYVFWLLMNVKEIYIIMTVKLLLLAEASLITLKNPNINNLLVISLLGNQAIHVEEFKGH